MYAMDASVLSTASVSKVLNHYEKLDFLHLLCYYSDWNGGILPCFSMGWQICQSIDNQGIYPTETNVRDKVSH
ncbi:MAG: hypothetical protein RLZZ70_719 [Candidatus Parcubacteria bacterium]|jgi:hypothetical protein